jgi:UDP-glucose 4-epimerase
MKKVLITGCAGFVGSTMLDFLLKKNFLVTGIDNLSTGKFFFLKESMKNKNFSFIKADLLSAKNLSSYFSNIDIVFHFSANADVRYGAKDTTKDLKQNVIVTSNILECMKKKNVKKIIFSSTGSVYGEASQFPTPENSFFPIQTSFYGASKISCESLISAYCESFDFQSWIFRFVSLLGPRYTHGHVIDFYKKIKSKKKFINVLGNGYQKKSYLHINDCIEGIYKSINFFKKKVNIINLGNSEYITVKESLKKIKQLMCCKKKEYFQNTKKGWVGDNPFIFLDIKKISKTGWKPKIKILDGITDTVNFLNYNQWILK